MSAEPTEPGQRRRIALGIAAAAVLVLVVVLFVVLQNRGEDDDPPSSSTTTTSSTGPSPSASRGPTTPGPTPTAPPVRTNPPKPIPAKITDKVVLDNGVAVEVADIESVKGEARGVGEVAGPALRFTIRVNNQSKKTIDLDLAIVNAYFGRQDDPAIALAGPGGSPLPQKLKAGGTATGKYVFKVPVKERDRVRVDFGYTVDQSTVIFRGAGR